MATESTIHAYIRHGLEGCCLRYDYESLEIEIGDTARFTVHEVNRDDLRSACVRIVRELDAEWQRHLEEVFPSTLYPEKESTANGD